MIIWNERKARIRELQEDVSTTESMIEQLTAEDMVY